MTRVVVSTLSAALIALSTAEAVTFTHVVDTDTPIPGGVGTFRSLGPPSLDGGLVAFNADGDIPPGCIVGAGIYAVRAGTVEAVVDACTRMPNCAAGLQFVGFSQPALGGGRVTFSGAAAYGGGYCRGVYTAGPGDALTVVADPSTPDPGGPGFLSEFFWVSRGAASVGFTAFSSGFEHRIYGTANSGALAVVADTGTPIPGGAGTFGAFDFNATTGDGFVAFTGGNQERTAWGVYLGRAGVERIADTETPIPGGSGTFSGFSDRPSTDGGEVAFHATGSEPAQEGIYADVGGALRVVADRTTPIPGGRGTFESFTSFYGPALDDGVIAFRGEGADGQVGIYLAVRDRLLRVVDLSETSLLPGPGRTLTDLAIDEESLDGRRLAFLASFSTDTPGEFFQAIYVATWP